MKNKCCKKQIGIMLAAMCVLFGASPSVETYAVSKSDQALKSYHSYLLSSEVEADNMG